MIDDPIIQEQIMEIAIDDVNRAGGLSGRKVRVIFADSRNNPTEGVSAFIKLIEKDKVQIVVSEMSSVSRALIPIAEKHQIILFATVTASPNLAASSDWVFRYYYTTDIQGKVMASFITNKLGFTKIGVLSLDDDYGTSSLLYFESELKRLGGDIVKSEKYSSSDLEVRTQLQKIIAANVEGLHIIAYDRALVMAVLQARELGIKIPIFGYTGFADPKVLELLGEAANGIYLTVGDYDPSTPQTENQISFINSYTNRFGVLPGHYPAFGNDVILCIAEAIKHQGDGSEAVRRGLLGIKNLSLAMGNISIESNGEVSFPQTVRQIKDMRIVPLNNGY